MPFGYTGNVLHVDLGTGLIEIEHPDDSIYRKYLGGSAFNMRYLLDLIPPGADPLGPENVLAIGLSVVTGVPVSGLSRLSINTKSPLTGMTGDGQCGGSMPVELKAAGFDAVVVKGISAKPVYLWIHDGQAELRDASRLWGLETGDTERRLKEELQDDRIRMLQIGPGGENRIRYACIMEGCTRTAGRNGMGAVMGAKRLKAVVARGKDRKISIADAEMVKEIARRGAKRFPESGVAALGKFGTNGILSYHNDIGGLPSYNYRSGSFKDHERINGSAMYKNILKGRDSGNQDREGRDTCFGCVIRCKRVAENYNGPYTFDPAYGGPEYETVCSFGTYCGVNDLFAIAKAHELCNRYGIDTISCGATISWAIDAFEKGKLSVENTNGLRLRYGDPEVVLTLVRDIVERKGFGDILAEGSVRAANVLGLGGWGLATCRGQELPAHPPHLKKGLGLIYAVNPFGGDHNTCEHDPAYEGSFDFYKERLMELDLEEPQAARSLTPEKVRFMFVTQCLYSLMDSLNCCVFAFGPAWQLYGPGELVEVVKAVTGWNVSLKELLQTGERRINMMRMFNAREGSGRQDDILPERFFTEPLSGGASDGWILDKAEYFVALDEYYRLAGWDGTTGNPRADTLERLGLSWCSG